MEEIMKEITEYCNKCKLKGKCPEKECALFRIEQLVLEQQKEDK